MARGRGGYQQPRNPAPVSGMGANSARTDGGPGNDRQPLRVPTGGPYGQAQALADQQRAAPIADVRPDTPTPTPPSAPPAAAGGGSVFTQPPTRPGAPPPPTAAPQALPGDPDAVLRMLYSLHPSPDILRLIRDGN